MSDSGASSVRRTALVTGASGYVGHHVCRALDRAGWNAHALCRADSNLRGLACVTRHDTDGSPESLRNIMQSCRPDVVLHLASMVKGDHQAADIGPMIEANITFGTRLIDAMSAGGCTRLIYARSYWEFGEDGEDSPNSLYAATKRAFASVVDYSCTRRGLSAIGLVLFDVYGPGDWRGKLLSSLYEASRKGATVPMSPGAQLLDLTHVDDVANAFVNGATLCGDGGHRTLSVESGRRVSLRELISLVEASTGRTINARFGELPYRNNQIMQPVTTLERLPGWVCQTALEVGLNGLG
jgi:nucleoside-diphosphate-sugar epimerase